MGRPTVYELLRDRLCDGWRIHGPGTNPSRKGLTENSSLVLAGDVLQRDAAAHHRSGWAYVEPLARSHQPGGSKRFAGNCARIHSVVYRHIRFLLVASRTAFQRFFVEYTPSGSS